MCGHFAYRSKQRGPYRGCGEEAYRRWMEYNRKKTICGENRNSYSKTDTDATFMHMKDDHMRNGQLKPGYNVQFAVNSGFITGIGVFSNRTDFGTLIPFLTYLWHKHGKSYRNVVADSGYESLANYRWLFENGQTAFIKPANYESGKKRSSKSQVGRMENMGYYEPDCSPSPLAAAHRQALRQLPSKLLLLRRASLKMSLSQRKTIFWRQITPCGKRFLPPWTRMLPTPH